VHPWRSSKGERFKRDLARPLFVLSCVHADGRASDIMKQPVTDTSKFSLPGVLAVKRVNGSPVVFPADSGEVMPEDNMLKVGGTRMPSLRSYFMSPVHVVQSCKVDLGRRVDIHPDQGTRSRVT
jgi:hypothetical protein